MRLITLLLKLEKEGESIMHSLKTLLSATLFVLCLATSTTFCAEQSSNLPSYTRKLSSMGHGPDRSFMEGHLHLDDGSIWEIMGYLIGRDADIDKWEQGDEIVILWNPPKSKGVYCLRNRQKFGQLIVALDNKALGKFPQIAEILNEGAHVKLTDNTLWEFSWWNKSSSKKWQPGQHLLVQGNGKENSYSFINLDISDESLFNFKSATGTFVKYE
jgi:IS5 family transposase